MRLTCARHRQPMDPELQVCWRCLAFEREHTRFDGVEEAGSWWHPPPSRHCSCPQPRPDTGWCLRCLKRLRQRPALAPLGTRAA